MSGSLSDILSDPGIDALLGAAQGFGQAAMPTRMPTPFGAVLGAGAGGLEQGLKTSQQLQQGAAQTQAAQMQNQLTKSSLPAAISRNNYMNNLWSNPDKMNQMLYGTAPTTPATAAPTDASVTPSTSTPSAVSGSVPIEQRPSLIAQANQGLKLPPSLQYGLIDYETGGDWNPSVTNKDSGAAGLPQALASTAKNPGYNTPPIDISKASPLEQAQWAGQYLQNRGEAAGVTDWTDPAQVTKALIAYHGPQKDANGIDGATYAQNVLARSAQYAPNLMKYGTRTINGAPSPVTTAASSATTGIVPPGGASPGPAPGFDANNQPLPAGWVNKTQAAGVTPTTMVGKDQNTYTRQGNQWGISTPGGGFQPVSYDPTSPASNSGGPVGVIAPAKVAGPAAPSTPVATPAPSTTSSVPSGITPQSAMQQALQYEQQANDLERRQGAAKFMGLPPPPGDPAVMRTAAQQYRAVALAGPTAAAQAGATAAAQAPLEPPVTFNVQAPDGKSSYEVNVPRTSLPALGNTPIDLNHLPPGATIGKQTLGPQATADLSVNTANQMPYDLRAGGMHVNPVTQQVVKNPEKVEIKNPDGTITQGHMNPASPYAPEGTPGTFAPVQTVGAPTIPGGPATPGHTVGNAVPPDVQDARNQLVTEFHGKDADSYSAAQNAQAWLSQIDHAADVMNTAGTIYQTGPYAAIRLDLMGKINDVGRSLNLGQPFNPKALSEAEELKKATTTAGFELASHYEGHSKQAASTIMNATTAIPSVANSPAGVQLVSAGINEGAQSAIDAHQYKQARYNGLDPYNLNPSSVGKQAGAGLETAETDFYKAFPAQMYAARMQSTVSPPTITAKTQADFNQQAQKYLPGTRIILNGQPGMVPPRPNAPPIPAYIMRRYPQAAPVAANGG